MASTLLGRVGVNCTPVGRVVAVSLLRHCSVLGSPACGGEGREEGVFREVLREFPGNRSLVFAYGSGVFQQQGSLKADNMVDFIFAVEDSQEWHRENLARHPSHYASLARLLGHSRVATIQRRWGARLYFNTLVPWGAGRIKYGVIDRRDLLADLLDWETLYTAGRLHKPVNILERREDRELEEALTTNLSSALHAALLLLPAKFSEEQLYLTIAGLSYTGDFRMVVGEDRNKVGNIVRPQMARFARLYRSRIAASREFLEVKEGRCEQDCGHLARLHHLELLPLHLTDGLVGDWSRRYRRTRDLETVGQARTPGHTPTKSFLMIQVCHSLAGSPDCDHRVAAAVGALVAATDKSQAAKGILTAGPRKAAIYAGQKLRKRWGGASAADGGLAALCGILGGMDGI